MSEEIMDGHVQFSGAGFKFFETLQPGLACEDPVEHSTCKATSLKRLAARTQADIEAQDARAVAFKAEIDALAKVKAEEAAVALKNRAGQAMHEARRLAGLKLIAAQDAAKDKAASAIAAAQAECNAKIKAASTACNDELAQAQTERDAREAEILATDWIAEVSPKEPVNA